MQGIEHGSAAVLDDKGELHAYYHCDYLGTTDYLTSAVDSRVISWTSYNEWGEIAHNAVLKCGQRELDLVKLYATHDYDAVLNQYYAKARFYDADTRRFTAMDPIPEPSAYDLRQYTNDPMQLVQYLYVKNNAVNYIDPTGEFAIAIAPVAIVLILAADGSVTYATWEWVQSPAGQRVIQDGAVAIYNGAVVAGKIAGNAAIVFVTGEGVIRHVTWGWVQSPAGQQAIKNGATAIYNGVVVAGKAGAEAAQSAVAAVSKGITWVNGQLQIGAEWAGGQLQNAKEYFDSITCAEKAIGQADSGTAPSYEDAKRTGQKAPQHKEHKQKGNESLSSKDETPNSSKDLVDKDGNIIQRRYYGPDGRAEIDIDYTDHGNPKHHRIPHAHRWDWSNPKHPIRPETKVPWE